MKVIIYQGASGFPDVKVELHGYPFSMSKGMKFLVSDQEFAANPVAAEIVLDFEVREVLVTDLKPLNIDWEPVHTEALDVTVIIPNYCTPDLVRNAVDSFRRFYPTVPLIVVDDGSQDNSTEYIRALSGYDPHTTVLIIGQNIGHGAALHRAINMVETMYFFTMDTDCEVYRGGFLELMQAWMYRELLYGCGVILWRDKSHNNSYLNCIASMYHTATYLSLPPFDHDGDPMQKNMDRAEEIGAVVKCFPIFDYIHHEEAGTRKRFGHRWNMTDQKRKRVLIYGNTFITAACTWSLLKDGAYRLVGYVPCTKRVTVPGNMPIPEVSEDTPCDLVLSIQYDEKIITDKPAFNVHTGLLPQWGGADILYHTLVEKPRPPFQGLTFHAMTDRLDGGPILAQTAYPVFMFDSIEDLYERLAVVAPPFVLSSLRLLDVVGVDRANWCYRQEPRMFRRGDIRESDRELYRMTPERVRERMERLHSWGVGDAR